MIGVVITFDEADNEAWVAVPETNLEEYVRHEASFQFSTARDFKGKIVGLETDFLVVKFDETAMGLGQGSQVTITE